MGRPKLPYVLIVGDIVLSLPAIALGIGFFTVMARSVLDGRMAAWVLIAAGLVALLLVLVGAAFLRGALGIHRGEPQGRT